ncbi:tape measure protein [Thiomicrorhabdus cannonii]|uniref:tape measure protein n=1 Tax=Thiomicrorhabdus cannonii TaxID=2748011 RepID=UPI0015B9EEF4|nr:tape measure protein [Thiomicrorhabdus cannonii]
MNDMKLAMIISLVDKVSQPLKKVADATGKLNKITEAANGLAKKVSQTGLVNYYQRLTSSTDRAARMQHMLGQALDTIRSKASQVNGHFKQLVSAGGEFTNRFSKAFAIAGGTIGAGVFGFKRTFLDTAATFEQFESVLETVEGSSSKAKASMDWIQNFATKTPYELTQVTEAFVRLRSYGMDPTNGLLRTLGDAASAMGKPIMQAVEAIADAVTGQNERLRELGITASTVGDVVTYTYTAKDGSTKILQALKNDRQQIQKVLTSIWDSKYAGSMDKQSSIWIGMWSNLMDWWTNFQKMVMDAGVFDYLKAKLQGVLDKINQMAANGQLQVIAERFGQGLIKTFDSLWAWAERFATGWDKFVDKANAVADVLGGWENTIMAIIALPLVPAIAAFVQAFTMLSVAILANPVGLVITAIAAAAALIIANWEKVKAFFGGFWSFMTNVGKGIIEIVTSIGKWAANIWEAPKQAWNDFLGWIDGFLNKLSSPFKTLMEYGSKLKSILGFDEEQKLTQKVQQVVEPAKKVSQQNTKVIEYQSTVKPIEKASDTSQMQVHSVPFESINQLNNSAKILDDSKRHLNDFLSWIEGFLNKLSAQFKRFIEHSSKLKTVMKVDDEQQLTQKVQQFVEPAKKAAQLVALTSVVATAPAMASAAPTSYQAMPIKVEVNAPITISGDAGRMADIGPQIEQHIKAAVEKAIQETLRGRNG